MIAYIYIYIYIYIYEGHSKRIKPHANFRFMTQFHFMRIGIKTEI